MTSSTARLATGCALMLSLPWLAACTEPSETARQGTPEITTVVPTQVDTPPPSAPATTEAPEETDPHPSDADVTTAPGQPVQDNQLGAYGVSAGHPRAAEAGTLMLEQGGNAVDAAIAAAFADSVLHPATSGIGGGGAAIVLTDGAADSYDYREVVGVDGTIPADHVGAPGFVAGMARLHEDHGSLPWADLLQPALIAAQDGVPVSGFLAMTLALPDGQSATTGLDHFRGADGSPLLEDDLLVQQDLANTLAALAQEGPQALYTGSLAQQLLRVPGLDAATVAGYDVQVLPAPSGEIGNYTLLSAAPALPGAALIQLVQIAESGGIADVEPYSREFVDLTSQAWGVAEESVQTVLGDPAFVDVPVDRLIDPVVNAALADQVLALGPEDDGHVPAMAAGTSYQGSGNTTHISVVDADGGAVSMTNTITYFWGSGRYVDGYFLNNHLERFEAIGTTDANNPSPGRRSVSWSAPSMVLDDAGRPVLVLGTPGGQQIPNTIASAVLRWTLHGEELEDLVAAPRFLHVGGELLLENSDLAEEMRELGYVVRVLDPSRRSEFGSLQALEVDWDQGSVTSVADDRRSGGFSLGTLGRK
ncbi:gamma-glutamyltransferase [Ornithinimicrobium sufpigmenti]|uniref:gamma-glutamyltransferase n=1 Tax=Ornithinimicrobium sufpigmenti TaxID=2508882 RepID=UPI0010366CC7|nr:MULTISPECIES: gamma-glutamyltransferase [unclassified Ornithinimicrobium]